jgi:hypothetical protein
LIVPISRGSDSEGRLEMVDGLLLPALGIMDPAKNAMKPDDEVL